jgi:hypothetical protein
MSKEEPKRDYDAELALQRIQREPQEKQYERELQWEIAHSLGGILNELRLIRQAAVQLAISNPSVVRSDS